MKYKIDIEQTIKTLASGEVILYPTDTIWGLGCDATNEEAVDKIYKIKQRFFSKSLIVLVDNLKTLKNHVENMPHKATEIISLQTKPTTIIYQNAKNLAKNAIAEDGSIAIRMPHDAFCKELIHQFGKPIISTSANISGEVSPQNFSEISEEIKIQANYVVKWRQDDFSTAQPSSIVLIDKNNNTKYIRK